MWINLYILNIIMLVLTLSIIVSHVEDVAQLMSCCSPHRINTRTTILTKSNRVTRITHRTNKCNTNRIASNINAPVVKGRERAERQRERGWGGGGEGERE